MENEEGMTGELLVKVSNRLVPEGEGRIVGEVKRVGGEDERSVGETFKTKGEIVKTGGGMFEMDEEMFEIEGKILETYGERLGTEEEMFETEEGDSCEGYEEREGEIGPDGREAKGFGRDMGKEKENKPDEEEGVSGPDDEEARLGDVTQKDDRWLCSIGSRSMETGSNS